MVVGGVLQVPLYTILFTVWRKHKEYLEHGRNWTSLERCAKSQLGTTRRKMQNMQAGQGDTYHCYSLFSNWREVYGTIDWQVINATNVQQTIISSSHLQGKL